jgi:fructosamine-3-kinase
MEADTLDAVERSAGCTVAEATELDGGEVGTVFRADLADGRRVVVKTAETDLTTEAAMLDHLAVEGGLTVPEVFHVAPDVLVLEFVEGSSDLTPAVERDLAERLAALHEATADAFGFPFDTLTGRFRQPNPWLDDWAEFFGEHRLGHAAERAVAEGVLPDAAAERVRAVVDDLPELLDHDPEPALIHGDVWRENLRLEDDGVRAFLDPACYYADPEVELAYVDWTETGGDAFAERYRELVALPDGVRERRPVYRLYPLLTHVRHFGESYLDPLRNTLAGLGY